MEKAQFMVNSILFLASMQRMAAEIQTLQRSEAMNAVFTKM
jgi:hypothetical protein